jgi:hypothetical protein
MARTPRFPENGRIVGFTSLSQRAARDQIRQTADSTIVDRQVEDCAAQDETVKKLIEALKLQELGARQERARHSRPLLR